MVNIQNEGIKILKYTTKIYDKNIFRSVYLIYLKKISPKFFFIIFSVILTKVLSKQRQI